MWEYNSTDNLYSECDSLYHSADELYHYGVLGMKWGHRKSQAVINANKEYKQTKKDVKSAKRKILFSKSTYAAGVENQKKAKSNRNNYANALKKRESSAFKLIDSAAKDAYNRKLSKTGSKDKATKASMKVHYKAFKQGKYDAGRVGSAADKGGGQRRYYNHMVKKYGKTYASQVEKKYNKKTTRALVASSLALVGSISAQVYLNKKMSGR